MASLSKFHIPKEWYFNNGFEQKETEVKTLDLNNKNELKYRAQYYPFLINKTNNQGDTPLHCAARAGKSNTASALVDFAKPIPSTSQAPVDLLRMENAMGNTSFHEALFMLGRVNVGRTSTADSFLSMARSYFSSNPTLAINDTIKKNIIDSLVAIAHFLVSLDPKLSCCKNIEDKSPLSLAIEIGNKGVLEYILRSLPSSINVLQLINQHKPEILLLEDRNGHILHHIFKKVLLDGCSLLHVAAKYGHGEIIAKIAQYYPCLINKTNNQGATPLYCAARAEKLNTATALVDFAKYIPSTSQAPVDLLRMENAMGNTALHEALFMVGIVNVGRTSTADSFLSMARSYFLSNPTLAIDDTIKTNIIDSLVAIAHFLVSLDPKLSCCNNIEDKSPLSLAIEMGNTNVLEYILRSLPSGISWSSGKSPLQVVIKKLNLATALADFSKHIPSTSQASVDRLRMENVMRNTALHEALFMLGRVNVGRTSTADSFLSMARSYFSSNPTLAIDDTIKTNFINSLVAIAHFLISLDPKLSCCKSIEDKSPLLLAIEMGNTDVLEYILRSLPSGISWSSGKSPLQVFIKKRNLEDRNGNILHHIFLKVLPDGSSLLHVAAKYGHGEITAKIAQYYLCLINKTNNQGDTPLHCAARAGKLNTATALADFAKHIPSTSQAPVDRLRMENAMRDTVLHEALFRLGRVNIGRTNVLQLINQHKPELLLLEDRNGNILHHIFLKVLPDGSSLLHVAAKYGHGEITAKIAQYYLCLINKTNNQGDTPLHCAARAGKLNTATALVDFAKHIPSTSQAPVDLLRMENAMRDTVLHEALFRLGRVNIGRTSTVDSFLSMARSYFSSNPTLAIDDTIKTNIIDSLVAIAHFLVSLDPKLSCCNNIEDKSPLSLAIEMGNTDVLEYILRSLPSAIDDTIKTNIIDSLVAIAHFLVSLDPKLSCCKNIEDKSPLSLAIEMGNTDVLEYILRSLPSGISWSSGKSPLQVVIKKLNLDVLQLINQHKPELLLLEDRNGNILHHIFEKVLPDGSSLLHVAAKYGHGEITAKIAQYYLFLINKTNNQGDTPLHCATRAGKLNTATALVDFAKHIPSTSHAPVDLLRMENAMGNTALHEALFMVGRVIVRRTSTADSCLSMARSYFSSNPTLAIDDTIKTNFIDSLVAIAHFLISLDPKLSCCKNIEDKSPLLLAIEMGNTDVLEYILRSLPSGISWSSGKSPLQVFIKKRNLDVLQLINQHKPELLLLEDRNGNIPLHYTTSCSALKKNKETLYPIHLACKNGHLNVIVELLKEWRCPSLFVTDNGCNILHFAAKNGHADMVKAIIEILETNMTMDEVVNKMDEDGNTPLHLAALHGHSQVVYVLLRYGRSNPDLKNKQSMTTYKMALREYYMQMSIAEKQEISMKSIGRAESLGASSRKSNENQDQLPIAYGESSGASAQRSHEFQDKLEKTLSIFLVTTRILKGESMPFLNPLLVGKLSEKEVQGFRKTLLVVAVLILGIAYSASEKMPSLDDAGSSNSGGTFSIQKLKTMIKQFLVFDNVGMNSATIAVLILLWAQIVKHSSTFKMVLVASVLVCLSIFSMSITFYYSEAIHVKKDSTSSPAIKFLAPLFMPIQAVLLFLLSISAFNLNHVLGLGQLHWYYFSLWVVFEHKKLKTGRLKWWKNG
ncbi:hypothetical protein WN943_016066 [Citrus x changshan-huyou]